MLQTRSFAPSELEPLGIPSPQRDQDPIGPPRGQAANIRTRDCPPPPFSLHVKQVGISRDSFLLASIVSACVRGEEGAPLQIRGGVCKKNRSHLKIKCGWHLFCTPCVLGVSVPSLPGWGVDYDPLSQKAASNGTRHITRPRDVIGRW